MFYMRLKLACEMRNIAISTAVKETLPSVGVIDNWKKGGMPRVDAVVKLANYLEVSTDYLLGLIDDPASAAHSAADLNGEEADLIGRLRVADPLTRMNVLKMAQAILPCTEEISSDRFE